MAPPRIVIAENQTGTEVPLPDLPINVPASGSANLSDVAPFWLIQESSELQTAIEGDAILLNDGSATLTKQASLDYLWGDTQGSIS